MNRNAATLLFFVWALPGCSLFATSNPPDVTIQEKPVPVVCSAVTERPDALDLKDTPPTLVMNDAQVWGFWFDSELYAALAENLQAMRRWMNQSNTIRRTLIKCIEDHNERARETPTE